MEPVPEALDSSTDAEDDVEGDGRRSRGKPLKNGEREAILHDLLSRSRRGPYDGFRLEHGAVSQVAKQHGVSRVTVTNIWNRGRASLETGASAMVVSHNKKNCGRKSKDHSEAIANMSAIPLSNRGCLRSTSVATGIPLTALHKIVKAKNGGIRKHTNTVKPVLTDENKEARVQYAMDNINGNHFDSMMDVVHVDEKWFFMKEVKKNYYLADGEEEPHRTSKSKRFIQKIMFLCAVARPRWDTTRNSQFHGKLGIWPFVHMVRAQRSSRNRPAGSMEMKPLPSIDRQVYKDFICNKVIPAINNKWPLCHRDNPIRIQQDNAKPHLIPADDQQLLEAVAATGLNISFRNQPPNSPDTNVLDLGYFAAIQSLQHKKLTNTIPELVQAVEDSFNEMPHDKLNKVFLSLQKCLECIILNEGDNRYKLPHMAKDRLARRGLLPMSIEVTDELRAKILAMLEEEEEEEEAVVVEGVVV